MAASASSSATCSPSTTSPTSPSIATPRLVANARRDGKPVYFGDVRQLDFLKNCGLDTAKAAIITIHTQSEIDAIVQALRTSYPNLVIVSRAKDANHARHLYEIGVNDAVPETIEASLQLSEAALVGLGVPTGPVIASIHEKRDEFRTELAGRRQKGGHRNARASRAASGSIDRAVLAGPCAGTMRPIMHVSDFVRHEMRRRMSTHSSAE